MDKIKNFVNFKHDAKYKFYLQQMKKDFKEALYDGESIPYISLKNCNDCIKKLNVFDLFDGFANSLNIVDKQFDVTSTDGYVLITIDLKASAVSAQTFPKAEDAEKAYIKEEVKYSNNNSVVVAMVSTPKLSELQLAYPNYFADSSVFLTCLSCVTNFFQDIQLIYFRKMRI